MLFGELRLNENVFSLLIKEVKLGYFFFIIYLLVFMQSYDERVIIYWQEYNERNRVDNEEV